MLRKLFGYLGGSRAAPRAAAPDEAAALAGEGDRYRDAGDARRAIEAYSRALDRFPGDVSLLYRLALSHALAGDMAAAESCYRRVLAQDPYNAKACLNLGIILHDRQQTDEARELYSQAIRLLPGLPQAHNCLGVLLHDQERYAEAEQAYGTALSVDPSFTEARYNLGTLYTDTGETDRAIATFSSLLEAEPAHADALANLGNACRDAGRFAEAIDCYDAAIRCGGRSGNLPRYHFNKGCCHLLTGNFRAGWEGYEWRRSLPESRSRPHPSASPAPQWTGQESLQGKTLLLHVEEGLGDAIFFLRFAQRLADAGCSVTLSTYWPLVELIRCSSPNLHVIDTETPPPATDYQCPLMSLPYLLGTELRTIPADIPYLRGTPDRIAQWQARLPRDGVSRIGLVWHSRSDRPDLRRRCVPLDLLLAELPDRYHYVSLQQEITPGDRALLAGRNRWSHFDGALRDFTDTAALAGCMDLVISIDTSVAHLAGALGLPVWIMLGRNADWRWALDREDCDWYPTARLFRQPVRGDWASVARALAQALAKRYPD